MRSVVVCYAGLDAGFARDLASFLHLNCANTVFEELITAPESDLIDTAERALSADYLLLLLSPDSWSDKWLRAKWEPVLVDGARKFDTRIAFVLLRACNFPQVLRRQTFFDLSKDRLGMQRALKRWLLHQDLSFQSAIELPEPCESTAIAPEALERLEGRIADQPGVEADIDRELALAFAHTRASEFEGVFWLDCANRSRAGILGDTAQILGLKLRGTLEQNARALQEFCATRRLLLVFEHTAPSDLELVTCWGKASVLFIAELAAPAQHSPEEIAAVFSQWRSNLEACLRSLGEIQRHLRDLSTYTGEQYHLVISLASAASSCLKHGGRLAEAHELLGWMADAMRERGDSIAAARCDWEKSWILEEWGEPAMPSARTSTVSQPVQLSLELSE